MYINIKTVSIITLLVVASSYVWAGEDTQNRKEQHQRPVFSAIDTNSDGTIELNEFSVQPIPHENHQTIFSHIDSNGDGLITEEEYSNHKPPRMNKKGHHND